MAFCPKGWAAILVAASALYIAPYTGAASTENKKPEQVQTDACGDALPPGALARLGTTRLKMLRASSVTVSPDGKSFALPNEDGSVSVWATASGEQLRRLGKPGDGWLFVNFSSDGKKIATGGSRGIALWDVDKSSQEWEWRTRSSVAALAFSSTRPMLAAAIRDGPVVIRDLSQLEKSLEWTPTNINVTALAFSCNGDLLCAAGRQASGDPPAVALALWDVSKRSTLHTFAQPRAAFIDSFAFSPDNKTLAANLSDRIHVWEIRSGETKLNKRLAGDGAGPAGGIGFTADGTIVIGRAGSDALQFLDPVTGKVVRRLSKPNQSVSRLGFSADGKIVVAAGSGVSAWNVGTGQPILRELPGHNSPIVGLAWSKTKRIFSAEVHSPTVRVWQADPAAELAKDAVAVGPAITKMAISASGTLAVSHGSSMVSLIDAKSRKVTHRVRASDAVGAAAFSRDGKLLVIGSSGGIVDIYKREGSSWPQEGKRLVDNTGARIENVRSIGVSPDLKIVVSGSSLTVPGPARAANAQVWDLRRNLLSGYLATCQWGVTELSPDARFLASHKVQSSGIRVKTLGVCIQEFASGGLVCVIRMPDAKINTFAFSPDSRLLAIANGASIVVYDVLSGQTLAGLRGHAADVTCLAWSPDGAFLSSGSADCTVLIWPSPSPPRLNHATAGASKTDTAALWEALGNEDPEIAYRAFGGLVSHPPEAVRFIKDRLPPSDKAPAKVLGELIASLDSSDFRIRRAAISKLSELQEEAEPLLRAALQNNPSTGAAQEIERMLSRLTQYPVAGAKLRALRALHVLETIGDVEAKTVLRSLAAGSPNTLQTLGARAALERLGEEEYP